MISVSDKRNEQIEKIGLVEKIGYGLGDTASNLVFQVMLSFVALYYTNTVGLNPATMGFIFLGVRLIDTITDPFMGVIADRTKSKMGRYRPWILWLAVPFGVAGVAAFSVPEIGDSGKRLYAFVSYAGMMIVYTAINIPYSALISAMTNDMKLRQEIQSWRFAGGQSGNLIVSSATLPLVAVFGGGAQGWQSTMIVFGVLAAIMFLICFATTRERIVPTVENVNEKGALLKDFKALLKNDQWAILAVINFVLLTGLVLRLTMAGFFVQHNIGNADLIAPYFTLTAVSAISGSLIAGLLSEKLNVSRLSLIGLFQVCLTAGFVALPDSFLNIPIDAAILVCITILLANPLIVYVSRKLKRVQYFTWFFFLMAVAHLFLYFEGGASFVVSATIFAFIGYLNQVAVPVLWAMMADSVDYGEYKTGRRTPGLNFSASLFALKFGVMLGGASAGWLLAGVGYETPDAEQGIDQIVQSSGALTGILISFALIPGVIALITAVIASRLKLSEAMMSDVQKKISC